jgi:hypothetical protein
VSQLPDPARLVHDTYRKLEPNRRRAAYAHRYVEDDDHHLDSVLVLRIALAVAVGWRAVLAQRELSITPAVDLFYWAYEQARRLWLTAVLDVSDTTRHLVTTAFAFMPAIFGEELGPALKVAIPPIASDSRMLAEACASLRRNNVDHTTIRELVATAGADLPAALVDAHRWSTLTDLPNEFPEGLPELAKELGLVLERPTAAPRTRRTARR